MIPVADNTDFSSIYEEIVFDIDTVNGTECFSLSVVDDEILEDAENFRVVLQTLTDTLIEFVSSAVLVTIIDDDGELVAHYGRKW